MDYLTDTIAAVSTAVGGGIAIVRMSGPEAVDIAKKLFQPVGKCAFQSHRAYYGHIAYNGTVIDECLLTVMKGPKSYTKEDVVEISSHGGLKSVEGILSAMLNMGARIAEPGEFTKRAFLNGRIDLVNAQAVIDIINSKTDMSHSQAVYRLQGKLSREIIGIRQELLNMLALIEVSIDYPEHDMEHENMESILPQLNSAVAQIDELIKRGKTGMVISQGIQAVIAGKPNVGKSSILNRILLTERAIVTDIPGTTRDILQETANIKGIPVNIVDTAGIRQTEDVVEKFGVEKSLEYAENADLILFVLDSSNEISDEDIDILGRIKDKKYIAVLNKCDLDRKINLDAFGIELENIAEVSARDDYGMENLYDLIYNMFVDGHVSVENTALVSNSRDMLSLKKAREHMACAVETIENGMTEDMAAIDIKECYVYLGQIIGETVEDDVIDRIFSQFCLGK